MALIVAFPTSAFVYSDNPIAGNSEGATPYYFPAIHYVDVVNHGNGYYTLSNKTSPSKMCISIILSI